ncbi:cytidylate kinase family protein [Desulfoluna butyratoxydans]|uniref:Bon domain n=1 Tax=Desulfoluna butyratoxydans TaxID=231438 RepID=A0A4U8YPH6_9BACT|nr:cytidylate kinase family protein [Desulfoluna butyratoxydans]VFQ46135.1 bon domain [Desulfoluna butyratoxydans]
MTVITVSRQVGSHGGTIAARLAEEKGYQLFNKERFHREAEGFDGHFSREVEALTNESPPKLFEKLFHNHCVYGNIIAAMVYEAAAADHVVVVGRGGQFILEGLKCVLNVRVVSPVEERIRNYAGFKGIEIGMAGDIIKASDRERSSFIKYLHNRNIAEPDVYDLIINTRVVSKDMAVRLIHETAEELSRLHPVTAEIKMEFRQMAICKRAELMLMMEMGESNAVKVSPCESGKVMLTGYLPTEGERVSAENIVRSVKGIHKVDNRIVVSQFPVRPWY